MAKKPRKSRHRIPDCALELRSDPISDRYWTEVWASTARLERQYRKAQQALEAAERRAEKARAAVESAKTRAANRQAQQRYDKLLLIVEDRRRELREIQRLMQADGYGRDAKRRHVRQEAGAITIPLGATTGQRPKPAPIPVFPVKHTKSGSAP
jgi:hypothetical protein